AGPGTSESRTRFGRTQSHSRQPPIPAMAPLPSPRPMLLLIDNYASFTWNLVQLIRAVARALTPRLEVKVARNVRITPDEAAALGPSHLVVSPGPCTPREAGASSDIIERLAPAGVPTLGVCLGHQCIADRFGGVVERAPKLMHGKTD